MACSDNVCRGSQIDQNLIAPRGTDQNTLMTKAELFLKTFYNDHKRYVSIELIKADGIESKISPSLITG